MKKINEYIKLIWIEFLELFFGELDGDRKHSFNFWDYEYYSERHPSIIIPFLIICVVFILSFLYSIFHLFSFVWITILFGLYIKVKLNNKNKK